MRPAHLVRYPAAALATAAYWYAAAWLCFAVTGHDPLDALRGSAPPGPRIAVAAIMAALVVAFALLIRRSGQGGRRHG